MVKQSIPSPLVAATLLMGCGATAEQPSVVDHPSHATIATATLPSTTTRAGKRVARAYERTCVLDASGAAHCWGLQLAPSLGEQSAERYTIQPAHGRVEGLPPLVDLAIDGQRSCGVDTSGHLWCWGEVPYYAPSWPILAKPTRFPDLEGVREVSLTNDHGCVLLESGAVACFGKSSGLGPREDKTPERPQLVAGFSPAAQVVTADDLTCTRRRDGKVECIGERTCGTPTAPDPSRVYRPFDDLELERLHADSDALCGVTRAGRVACVPCAHPLTVDSRKAKTVEGPWSTLRDVSEVWADAKRGCALHTNGTVSCWGELAASGWDERKARIGPPARITELHAPPISTLDLNLKGACALTRTGQVACWGFNRKGEIGLGAARLTTPGKPLIEDVVDVATSYGSTCALGRDRRVRCFGLSAPRSLDGTVPDLSDVTTLFSGYREICALAGSTLTCLEGRAVEQLPVTDPPIHVSSDSFVRCMLHRSGRVRCSPRTLGNSLDRHHQVLEAQRGVTALAVGPMHACFTLRDGVVRCAGNNQWGALGREGEHEGVVRVQGPKQTIALEAGESMTCALEKSGAVWCWGADWHLRAALGDKPRKMLDHARSLSVGESHACAVDEGKGLVCWGSDLSGQLGDDEALAYKPSPTPVQGLREVSTTVASEQHSCAVTRGGALHCWGSNADGQLGALAARGFYEEPVVVLGGAGEAPAPSP